MNKWIKLILILGVVSLLGNYTILHRSEKNDANSKQSLIMEQNQLKGKVTRESESAAENLYENYAHYHIPELNFRRIKRTDIEPFIEALEENKEYEVSQLGESVQGRPINLVKTGNGPKKVFLWSQMHGDESTATRALFEIFKFLSANDDLDPIREKILKETTLYVIPMLNPDGAEVFQRRNALSVDLNRDALRLISPEARILKGVRDKYEPEFGFNLHDQSKYYNVYKTGKTASISFLAPAFNYDKDVNEGRGNAMKLIVSMNSVLQQFMPGHVGRYDDAFEPRAFGDNIQKWGTNTILIESGGYIGDPEKKELVKMNFVAILHALYEIADEGYKKEKVAAYYQIPENDRMFFDVLIRNGQVTHGGKDFLMDVGIFQHEHYNEAQKSLYYTASIDDRGDLSTFYGYKEIDASGMEVSTGEIYPDVLENVAAVTKAKAKEWIKQGYSTVRLKNMPNEEDKANCPIYVVSEDVTTLPELEPGNETPVIIRHNGQVKYAVINGEIMKLND